jgi:peptidoglycan/xylan/chitin deacetylase (PgdA/CDA1 family)
MGIFAKIALMSCSAAHNKPLHRTAGFGHAKSFTLLLIALLLLPLSSQAQTLALTFDDGLDPREQPQAVTWNRAILEALSKAHIRSVLFVAGERVDIPEGLALVRDWGTAGHGIGNHTYSHLNFGSTRTTLEAFTADIASNESLLESLPGWTRLFRFPYLKEGETAEKRDGIRRWLTAEEYKTGAVSIDASDWYYNQRYLEWKKEHSGRDLEKFRAAYLDHLWDRATYYNTLSESILNRSTSHILLLHTNAINSDFLSDVIAMFISKGWTFVSPEEAYEDPIYAKAPSVLPAGESVLWSLAKQRGFSDLRYPAEDSIYEKPLLDELGL